MGRSITHEQNQTATGSYLSVEKPGAVERFVIQCGRSYIDVIRREIACFDGEVLSVGEVKRSLGICRTANEINVLAGVGENTQLGEGEP
jgi:hypothetical protein